jgi:TMEM175 potassium channel family protein
VNPSRTSFPDDLDADPGNGIERLIGLTDGIFAFSMTLLAVDVNIPQLAVTASAPQVTDAVVQLLPQIIIYVTSFLLVGLYWQINRRVFRFVKRVDGYAVWLILLQLMCVAFLPVATGLFDTFGDVTAVILLYAGTLTAIGILGQLFWFHAIRARLLDESMNPILVEYYTFRGTVTTLVYLLVMVVAVVSIQYARLVFLLMLGYPFLQSLFRRWYQLRHKENLA